VEQFGAGSRAEGVKAFSEPALELIGSHDGRLRHRTVAAYPACLSIHASTNTGAAQTPTRDNIHAVGLDDVRSLLDAPSPAALVTYRADGSADVSPVWYRCTDSAFEVVVAVDDPKLRRIAVDDRAVLTVFETVPPFRGVKVAGRVTRDRDPMVVREAREAIASRYLGETRGAAFVERRGPGVVIRLPIASARAWDLEAALPPTSDQGT
jgi:hypothetical protein